MVSSIIIFTKTPIPGLVKTRLTQTTCLNEFEVTKLAKAMLQDTISLASKTIVEKIYVSYFPSDSRNKMVNIIDSVRNDGNLEKEVEFLVQIGSNFDQRFSSIVNASFKDRVNCCIIIGADLPFLDPQVINNALKLLLSNYNEKPLIIGPSSGGGIYLIGLTNDFHPNWFKKYKFFETGVELSQIVHFSILNEFKLIILPPYGDIDLEEDLVSLIAYTDALKSAKVTDGFHFPYYTAKLIDELGLYIIDENNQTRNRRISKKRKI